MRKAHVIAQPVGCLDGPHNRSGHLVPAGHLGNSLRYVDMPIVSTRRARARRREFEVFRHA